MATGRGVLHRIVRPEDAHNSASLAVHSSTQALRRALSAMLRALSFGSMFEISWVTNTALGSNGETQVQCRHVRSSRSGFQKISFQIRQHKLLENCTEIVISHTSSVKLPLNIAETKVSTLLCEVHPKELGVQLEPYASATGARVTGFSSRPGQLEQARVPLGARIIRIDESSVSHAKLSNRL